VQIAQLDEHSRRLVRVLFEPATRHLNSDDDELAPSAQRVSDLRAIEAAAELAADEGKRYPLLTLEMGIAFHQAMIDVCTEFERNASA